MPRGPRLDAPGTLHHIIVRGIERRRIFESDRDREGFLDRRGEVFVKGNGKFEKSLESYLNNLSTSP
jgi:hypothetical protein